MIGPDFDPAEMLLHDVPADAAAEAMSHAGEQSDADARSVAAADLARWSTRVLVTRHDRFLPVTWQAQVVADRFAIRVDETPGGRCVALSRPADLIIDQLERLRRDDAGRAPPEPLGPRCSRFLHTKDDTSTVRPPSIPEQSSPGRRPCSTTPRCGLTTAGRSCVRAPACAIESTT